MTPIAPIKVFSSNGMVAAYQFLSYWTKVVIEILTLMSKDYKIIDHLVCNL